MGELLLLKPQICGEKENRLGLTCQSKIAKLLAYAGYGRLHQQQGNIAQAREYFTRALRIFERLGTLGEPDKVRKALAELPRGIRSAT